MSEMNLFAPLSSLQWVERERLRANDYNPNKVSEDGRTSPSSTAFTAGQSRHGSRCIQSWAARSLSWW